MAQSNPANAANAAATRPQGRKPRSTRTTQLTFAYGVVIPLFIVFIIFQLWPIVRLFDLSLRSWSDVIAGRPSFVGFDNYRQLREDPVFLQVLINTFKFTLLRVPLGMAIALVIALALDQMRRLKGFHVFAWFSPFMTSIVSMALVFTYFYHPTYGLFNNILTSLGLPPQRFLNSTTQALPSIVVVDLWKTIGFSIVIFMAGLSGIPGDYYDAASVDGASAWQRFRRITMPLLTPTTYLLLLMNVVTAMRVFTPIYMMTSIHGSVSGGGLGGPLNSTNVLTLYMYQQGFQYSDFTYASAISIVLFAIVFAFTLLQFRLLRVTWEY